MIFPNPSLKRSPRTRTRKDSTSADTETARCKVRPPPLQIIPELSENVLDISAANSLATARPIHCISQQPESVSSRVTLSAYTFSIDDALLMFAGDAPRSPALSASSSTSDSTSSEDVPATPRTSDDEVGYDFVLRTPRRCSQRLAIRPLCVTKTRPLICQEDEDIHDDLESEEKASVFSIAQRMPESPAEAKTITETTDETEHDFYTREFEGFVSHSPIPSPISPARRDSLILVDGVLPVVTQVFGPTETRGRSRHSKPLPLLPPTTPPAFTFSSIPSPTLAQTIVQKSAVRRKRSMQPAPNCPPPPIPVPSRPRPRMSVPLDIEDCIFSEENLNVTSTGPIVIDQTHNMEDDASIYSHPSLTCMVSAGAHPLPPVTLGTPGEIILPRSSTDSDAPRSSTDSASSFASSTSSLSSPFYPSSPCEERLRSRWSSSTLGSLAVESPHAATFFSPFKGVFGSRMRRVPALPQKMSPPKLAKNKHCGNVSSSSLSSTSGMHIRRQGSRSSTSSTGTSSSECDGHDTSPSGPKRKPIPVAMFLRSTS